MSGRPSAGRDVVQTVEALMNGLLIEERRAADDMTDGIRGLALSITERTEVAGRPGRAALSRAVPSLLPTPEDVLAVIGPSLSELLAASRERVLPVVARQLRTCQQAVGPHALSSAGAGVLAAEESAGPLEEHYYSVACATIGAATTITTGRMREQARIWAKRGAEKPEDLARRWCSEDLVRLPGITGRGVIWALARKCAEEGRAASVQVVNGLLLAGYSGWNRAARAS